MSKHKLGYCFLFIEHLDKEGCLCLRLNDVLDVEVPLAKRSPEDIHALQEQAKTIIVAPMAFATIHKLTFPWLGERKAREALPFALEEQLAQPVTELHFAFDKAHYRNGQYLVVVMDKQQLSDWMSLLDELSIDFDQITLDWFGVHANEMIVTKTHALIHHDDFKGALTPNLMSLYQHQASQSCTGLLFDDSAADICSTNFVSVEGPSELFIAKRLAKASCINLCQGMLKHDTHRETNVRWYKIGGVLFGCWLLSILGVNAFNLYRLNTQHAVLEQQIAAIYREFFPDATLVISPKFRIEQLLKTDATAQQGAFWYLLELLVQAVPHTKQVVIEQLRFQNQSVVLNLTSDTFATLESFENDLKKASLQVTQTQASSNDKRVTAILELRA